MLIWDIIKLSTRMFKARASRTFLTILGMGVGIGAVLFLVSFGYGLQKTLLEKITTSDSLLTIDVSEAGPEEARLDNEALEKIKNMEGVAEVSPRFNANVRGKIEGLTSDIVLSGIGPIFLRLGGVKMIQGKMLNDDDLDGVIITTSAAKAFNLGEDNAIGKEVQFVFPEKTQDNYLVKNGSANSGKTKYKIIGIIEEEENSIFVNILNLDNFEINRFDQIKVKCESSGRMGGIREQIMEMGFSVSSLSDAVDQANKVFRIVKIILLGFGFLALIVSAIGMFNTMTITLMERTGEIGIMKSIGASDTMISQLFITEATIMGFFGGVVGVSLGFLIGQIFNWMLNFVASHFGGSDLSLFYTPAWFIAAVIFFGTVVGFATGVIPARRASRIDPLDALRDK